MEKDMSNWFPNGLAVVAGGSGGLGAAICAALAAEGCDIALTYRSNEQRAQKVVSDIHALGRQASAAQLDLGDAGAVTRYLEKTHQRFGRIYSVVYAAGPTFKAEYISKLTAEEWARTMSEDANGCFNLMSGALGHMRELGGSLCAITTCAVERSPEADVLSAAPKAAIEALMRGIAKEEGRFGIRANSVAPGCIDAGIGHAALYENGDGTFLEAVKNSTPMRQIGSADDIAQAVAFLCSGRAKFITGQSLAVDGGLQL
jgi:NAD(P)-dependent dehydrogenase (short-subunit alcohol dehydrogenase family)